MEDHEHGAECHERLAEYRRERAAAILSAYEDDKRDALLQGARRAAEKTIASFEGFTPAQVGEMLETIAQVITQIMTTPAYELSATLTDSSSVYALASAHLLAGFELPESGDDLEGLAGWAEFLSKHADETEIKISDDGIDFRPGNYL